MIDQEKIEMTDRNPTNNIKKAKRLKEIDCLNSKEDAHEYIYQSLECPYN